MTTPRRGDILDASTAEYLCTEQYPGWLWRKLDRFQDWRFGLFMHWGPCSLLECDNSWSLVENEWSRPDNLKPWIAAGKDPAVYRKKYLAAAAQFNPVKFCPEKWADLAKYAGMKYMVFTSKHHDGFCLFDTATTDYRVTHPSCAFSSHPRANILKEVFSAFREKGFGIGCYFSKPDWHSPDFWDQDKVKHDRFPDYDITQDPARWQRFVAFTHRQFEELMADYGAIDMLWLDGGWIRKSEYDIDIPGVAKMARSHHPELLMVDRACGGLFENIITPEQMHDMPAKPYGHPWEICVTMANSWGYVGGEEQKPARTLIHLLIEVVAKDGNLLLNVGPRADGTFPPEAEYRLCAIGDWMRVNAEAIHGTRAIQPYQEGDIRYTRKGSVVYAIILSSDEQSPMPKTVRIEQLPPAADNPVFLLGCDEPLQIIRDGSAAVVVLPPAAPCRHAWTLRYQNNETMECV